LDTATDFRRESLSDHRGRYLVTVLVPDPPPSVVAWGARVFAWDFDGYRETGCLQVFTAEEHAAQPPGPDSRRP
jgi:hypothetical protein